ncbi:hypothetical protein ADL15_41365 [Actinoplanes awajinensis subsp. mycoplanecinus]|uniref:Uncharacterized protein n=1 Tax=Actinoplanes awajinensis subsp. mycoplanecinus TaxID=135947 RepID=A0A101JE97_9ACTN|nr:hypothetical protein ADL15_41365 [Actinoplanes awajinensis subsp. mycoplanecinus]
MTSQDQPASLGWRWRLLVVGAGARCEAGGARTAALATEAGQVRWGAGGAARQGAARQAGLGIWELGVGCGQDWV